MSTYPVLTRLEAGVRRVILPGFHGALGTIFEEATGSFRVMKSSTR
jgi:hypothetical protein